jgi:hypothetical protein
MYISTLTLTSALDRWEWSAPRPPCFTPRKDPVPIAWVGSTAGLDGYGISRLHQDSIPGPSSLYRIAIPTGKGKGVPVHVTESNSGSRSKASLILNLRNGWKWLNSRTGLFCEQEMSS